MPHVIPADPASGPEQDVMLYENAMIFAAPPNGQANPAKMAFLQAPDMVKIGDTWKFVELPRAVDPEKPIVPSEGGLRAALRPAGTARPASSTRPGLKGASRLADEDNKDEPALPGRRARRMPPSSTSAACRCCTTWSRSPKRDAETKLNYKKQIVDSLVAAYQTGAYPKGRSCSTG